MPARPLVLVVGVLATCLGLAACSSGGQSTTAATAPATSAAATSAPATSAPPVTTSSTPVATSPAKAAGRCSMIDQAAAATILGFSTQPGLSSSAASGDATMKKVDGCVYQNLTSGSLGYDVVQVDAQLAQAMVGAAKARMAGAGAAVVVFDTGIASSIAFTMHLPKGVDSQITAQSGDLLLSVSSTRKDGDAAKSQAAAIAAMQHLIAAG
jgi:hypothetical protein